jgi:hypothetical protein
MRLDAGAPGSESSEDAPAEADEKTFLIKLFIQTKSWSEVGATRSTVSLISV